MIIAFEGPDKMGKSTLAEEVAHGYPVVYGASAQDYHDVAHLGDDENTTVALDRVDWITHMVYRLALPEYEWNDPHVRTVHRMPQAHLVMMVPASLSSIPLDELYLPEQSQRVVVSYQQTFQYFDSMMNDPKFRGMFKTLTLLQVDPLNGYRRKLVYHRQLETPCGHTVLATLKRLLEAEPHE